MSDGISGYNTTLTGSVTGKVGQLTKLGINGMEVNDIDVTWMESPERWREFIAGLKDAKEIQCEALYEKANMAMLLAALGDVNEDWTILLPDGSIFMCEGYIKTLGAAIPMDDKISQPLNIKLSGKPTFTPA